MSLFEQISQKDTNSFQELITTALSAFEKLFGALSEQEFYQSLEEQLKSLDVMGGIALLDTEGKTLLIKHGSEPVLDFAIRLDTAATFSKVVSSREPVYVENSAALLSELPAVQVDHQVFPLSVFGEWPAAICPLFSEEKLSGVLFVAGREFETIEFQFLQIFARYVGISLSNVWLVEKLNRQFRKKYKGLFENLPIGFYRVSPEGRFLMANSSVLEIFGLEDFSQLEGSMLDMTELTPRHDRKKLIEELIENGKLLGRETEWETKDGTIKVCKENITASYDKKGNLQYFEGSIEDITAQKQAEEKMTKQLTELMLLNQISSAGASSTNIDDFLEQVTQIISETVFSEHFGAILFDRTIKKLRVHKSYRGIGEDFYNKVFDIGEGVVGKVFEMEHPLRIPDVRKFAPYIQSTKNIRSELCVPIKASGQVLGVLNAERKVVNGFNDDDEILLVTIAGQMAAVLERAKFVTEVENKANQLSLLNQATLTTSRILEPDELIQLIAKQIIDLFNPDSFSITLFDDQTNEIEIAIAVEEGSIDSEKSGVRISFSQGGLTTLLRDTGQVLQIDDLENSPLLVGYHQFAYEMRGSWLGIPLISGTKILGALTVQYYEKKEFEIEQTQFLESLASHASIAINNGRLFDEIQTRYQLNTHLAKLSEDLNRPQTMEKVIETIGQSSISLANSDMAAVYVRQNNGAVCSWSHNLSGQYTVGVTQGLTSVPGVSLLNSQEPILIPDIKKLPEDAPIRNLAEKEGISSIALWPLVYEEQTIAAVGCYRRDSYIYSEAEKDVMMAFARQAAVSLENARLLESERSRRLEAEALYKTTLALTSSLDIDQVLSNILVELYRVIDYHSASLHLQEGEIVRVVAAEGLLIESNKALGVEYSSNAALFQEMLHTRQPIILANAQEDPRFREMSELTNVRGWIGVPLVVGENMIGILTIDSDQVGAFAPSHATQAVAFANQAAIAIETARLFSQTQRRLHVLQSIHTIDQAISSNLDLSITLDVFVEQAISLLDVEAVKVFAYDPDAQLFDLLVQRDLVANRPKPEGQFIDPALVDRAISSRDVVQVIHVGDSIAYSKAKIVSYFVSPLVTKGQARGVLEVFSSNRVLPNEEWLELLNTLSTQAAISIENDDLITSLQKSNEDLVIAYDRTLEGWAYALELRDRETIGHARRVTEQTVKLARMMGIKGTDLANIRRGTLLHDIGKMGLPDSVLLKDGPLTKEEEKLMQTHPQLAYDMLATIPYLKPALSIPYYHHEKWDGSGYPHGLKGEEIPLSARIFSVVDVWDAVIYDRPYRGAWDKQKAIDYIKSESGKHFDPQVVQKFLEMVE